MAASATCWRNHIGPTTATTHKLGTLDFITLNDSGDVYGWFDSLWRLYAYTPLGNLAGIALN